MSINLKTVIVDDDQTGNKTLLLMLSGKHGGSGMLDTFIGSKQELRDVVEPLGYSERDVNFGDAETSYSALPDV